MSLLKKSTVIILLLSFLTQGHSKTLQFPEGKYKGDVRRGLAHGQGTFTYSDGKEYTGSWNAGSTSGFGVLTRLDGSSSTGIWKKGKLHGQATVITADGARLIGEWREGREHGEVTTDLSNGDRHTGEWKEGKPTGTFKYYFANQDLCVGPATGAINRRIEITGEGSLRYTNKDLYEGKLVNCIPDGTGRYSDFSSGEIYQAQFKNGKRINAQIIPGSEKTKKLVNNKFSLPRLTELGEDRIVLSFADDVWFEIKNVNGDILHADLGKADQVREYVGMAPFQVKLGFASAATLKFNGDVFNLAPYTSNNVAKIVLGTLVPISLSQKQKPIVKSNAPDNLICTKYVFNLEVQVSNKLDFNRKSGRSLCAD